MCASTQRARSRYHHVQSRCRWLAPSIASPRKQFGGGRGGGYRRMSVVLSRVAPSPVFFVDLVRSPRRSGQIRSVVCHFAVTDRSTVLVRAGSRRKCRGDQARNKMLAVLFCSLEGAGASLYAFLRMFPVCCVSFLILWYLPLKPADLRADVVSRCGRET